MRIELVFVKGVAKGPTPAEVELVESFGLCGYQSLGHALFSQAQWAEDGSGRERFGAVTAEIVPGDAALAVTVEGSDARSYVRNAAAVARRYGVVTIDVREFAVLSD